MMVSCHFDSRSNRLRVILPLRFTSSIDLIAMHFAAVKNGTVVGVFGVKLCSLGDVEEGSLCHGLATEVVKILQLKPPSANMEERLEGLRKHRASPSVSRASASASASTSASSSSLATTTASPAAAQMTDSVNGVRAGAGETAASAQQDVDFDLQEGLNLLLQQEIVRQKCFVSVQGEGDSAAGVNATDAVQVLEHALSDFHHLPDDLELAENDIADEICGETGEELVSRIEAALVKKVLDSGQRPCKNQVDNHMQAGLGAEDAVNEAVLNTEAGFGNFDDNNDCSADLQAGDDDEAADAPVEPGSAQLDHGDSDCSEPPGHLAYVYVCRRNAVPVFSRATMAIQH